MYTLCNLFEYMRINQFCKRGNYNRFAANRIMNWQMLVSRSAHSAPEKSMQPTRNLHRLRVVRKSFLHIWAHGWSLIRKRKCTLQHIMDYIEHIADWDRLGRNQQENTSNCVFATRLGRYPRNRICTTNFTAELEIYRGLRSKIQISSFWEK